MPGRMNFAQGAAEALERKKAGLYALLQNWAGQVEGYAKTHAAWVDRTGHARQGLHAGVDVRGDTFILYLSHGVEYGVWLELACKPRELRKALWYKPGPYSIVIPTMQAHAPRIGQTVRDYWRD